MKNCKTFIICIFLLSAFITGSCGDGIPSGDYKSFDYKLFGTWVSNETGLYSGTLVIDYDTIIIDGYGEDWTSLVGDDSKRPFRDFPKRVPLKGYSKEGEIFIEYSGIVQNGIPYIYTEAGNYPVQYKLLELPLAAEEKYYNGRVITDNRGNNGESGVRESGVGFCI